MLAPYLKSKVDKLWNHFWTAGITNPLVAIEQITYLLFLKRLEGLDADRVNQGKTSIYDQSLHEKGDLCRWSFIKQQSEDVQHIIEVVFPWLREIEQIIGAAETSDKKLDSKDESELKVVSNRMSDAYFQLDPTKGAILSQAIALIDELFSHIDASSVDDDLMGDIFEYLLSEVSSSGKNGQFRTPRHIIRVLVELLDPKPGERVIDPAAGTGGFLFSAMSHIMKQNTPEDMLKVEWDGTPHRATGADLTPEQDKIVHQGNYYVGLDNDRTMVRIGWMNMILHGIGNPQIHQRDSLGKTGDTDQLKGVLESESFHCVLANPPFTGTVDKGSLDLAIFPKAGTTPKKAKLALTDKSELLFIWRMLDLMAVGGRCAVIIPEGVLFGSTEAHTRLRRELLTEHTVEAVISLPGGAFQPYTGVKTSIVIFQKDTPKAQKAGDASWVGDKVPRTERVWFYEVGDEAYTPDAKRRERKGEDNDLWDMLAKFNNRHNENSESLDYYQPKYRTRRWRLVDDNTLKVFPENRAVSGVKGKVAAIQDLFNDLPELPKEAEEQVDAEMRSKLRVLLHQIIFSALSITKDSALEKMTHTSERKKKIKEATALFGRIQRGIIKGTDSIHFFEKKSSLGLPFFQKACKEANESLIADLAAEKNLKGHAWKAIDEEAARTRLEDIARGYAKLDGYDVMLRSIQTSKRGNGLEESKSWWADVRVHARDDEWKSEDGKLQGSHDNNGKPRPEYLSSIELYDLKTGKLNDQYITPECVEAKGWSLAAGQYKPFNFPVIENEQTVAEIIVELEIQEKKIISGLKKLKKLVNQA